MQSHVTNYLKAYKYTTEDYIGCQVCQKVPSVDIHHIIPRSRFGKKRKKEQDDPNNLIAVCRKCHEDCHNHKISTAILQRIVKSALEG